MFRDDAHPRVTKTERNEQHHEVVMLRAQKCEYHRAKRKQPFSFHDRDLRAWQRPRKNIVWKRRLAYDFDHIRLAGGSSAPYQM